MNPPARGPGSGRGARRGAFGIAALVGVLWLAGLAWWPRDDGDAVVGPVVVVLNAGVRPDGGLGEVSAERLAAARRLARQRGAVLVTTRVLTPTGDSSDAAQRRFLAADTGRWMILPGVMTSTREEAVAARQALAGRHVSVVTSGLHSRRACATFERAGFLVTCHVAPRQTPWWRMPRDYTYEILASVKYRLSGWL